MGRHPASFSWFAVSFWGFPRQHGFPVQARQGLHTSTGVPVLCFCFYKGWTYPSGFPTPFLSSFLFAPPPSFSNQLLMLLWPLFFAFPSCFSFSWTSFLFWSFSFLSSLFTSLQEKKSHKGPVNTSVLVCSCVMNLRVSDPSPIFLKKEGVSMLSNMT